MTQKDTNLIWLDLEMTGLDTTHHRIIEIATVITDTHLNPLAEGPVIAVYQSDEVLNTMDDWCTNQHGKSGLTQRVRDSQINEAAAEQATLEFVKQWVNENKSPLCGNSIYQDRRFLAKYMPTLERYCHYRNLDVSTLKILAERWKHDLPLFSKESAHLALSDIYDSINELKYYREKWLK